MRWLLYSLLLFLLCGMLSCCDTSRKATQPVGITPADKEAMIAVNKKLIEQDDEQIKAYIKARRLDMQPLDNGSYGMITKSGEGLFATDGTSLKLKATISLLDGEVCYKDTLIAFIAGKTTAISGLHQIAKQLQKGTQATYIFPPSLAYGIYGDGHKIPQRSILRYDIDVLEVNANKKK